jgi:hypothetical protein
LPVGSALTMIARQMAVYGPMGRLPSSIRSS